MVDHGIRLVIPVLIIFVNISIQKKMGVEIKYIYKRNCFK